jgi:hypothetical protein
MSAFILCLTLKLFNLKQYSVLNIKFYKPNALATAKKGTSSKGVERLIGPLCPGFGRFHTTLGTPSFIATLPPALWIRCDSSVLSGLWSFVRAVPCQLSSPVKI